MNFTKVKDIDFMNLTDLSIKQEQEEEKEQRLCRMFKIILIYTSKMEDIKNKIFQKNQDFDILGIFEIYDEDMDGCLSEEDFERFLEDLDLKIPLETMVKL